MIDKHPSIDNHGEKKHNEGGDEEEFKGEGDLIPAVLVGAHVHVATKHFQVSIIQINVFKLEMNASIK